MESLIEQGTDKNKISSFAYSNNIKRLTEYKYFWYGPLSVSKYKLLPFLPFPLGIPSENIHATHQLFIRITDCLSQLLCKPLEVSSAYVLLGLWKWSLQREWYQGLSNYTAPCVYVSECKGQLYLDDKKMHKKQGMLTDTVNCWCSFQAL